jgi:hypothetical protein
MVGLSCWSKKMPDVKISALPASTTPLAGTEVLPIVQSATTRQVSVANLTAGRAVSALSIATTTGATFATTSGLVGIGTSSPPAKLSIASTTTNANTVNAWTDAYSIFGPNAGSATGSALGLGYNTTLNQSEIISITPSISWKPLQIYSGGLIFSSSNGVESARIDTSGNVGIGTSSPNRLLSLYATQPVFQITNVACGNTQGTIQYQTSGGTDFVLDNQGSGSGGTIIFQQAGSERMRISSAGLVGIGVTPTAILDVLGSFFNGGTSRTDTATKTFGFRVPHCFTATNPMNVIGGLSTTSVNNVYIGGSDSNIGGTAATDLYFYTAANNTTADGTLRMRIDASGIVTMSAYGAGAATFSASGVISSVSDETWKTKDGVPTNTDAMLQKLEPGYWFYNEEKAPTFGADRQLGFYAQNVREAIGEEAAPTPEEGKPWGYYDRSVLAVAVMSLKNALNTIEELKQRITALENK